MGSHAEMVTIMETALASIAQKIIKRGWNDFPSGKPREFIKSILKDAQNASQYYAMESFYRLYGIEDIESQSEREIGIEMVKSAATAITLQSIVWRSCMNIDELYQVSKEVGGFIEELMVEAQDALLDAPYLTEYYLRQDEREDDEPVIPAGETLEDTQ